MNAIPPCTPIGIIVPPNAQLYEVSGLVDTFLEANRQSGGGAGYELCVVSTSADKTVLAGGMSLVADASIFDEDRRIDTLIVAGTSHYALAYESADLQAWLRRRVPQARRCGSIGTGAFFLGSAGLLDGVRATTHRRHMAELAARCPAANILLDRIYVEDGKLYTSAGCTAGINLALKFIEEDHGRELAQRVACRFVELPNHLGLPSQFDVKRTGHSGGDDRIRIILHWIPSHLSLDLTLKALAERTGMGVRHFTRVFRREIGTTPGDFVEMTRVEAARRLIEESDLLLRNVALRCGFANSDVMCRAFLRRVGTKPSLYREKFRKQGSGAPLAYPF